jgi:hypothetical protein
MLRARHRDEHQSGGLESHRWACLVTAYKRRWLVEHAAGTRTVKAR